MSILWLKDRLQNAYGELISEQIWRGYETERPVTLRVNLLKTDTKSVMEELFRCGIETERVDWYDSALTVKNVREESLVSTDIYRNGQIYLQSLSSMLPPLYLEPCADENILDMTAAPGGKTTQMSALSYGRAFITACERDAFRAERLRFNIEKQGAPRVTVLKTDALKLDDYFQFDKILLDAPCSGSGTLNLKRSVKISEKLVAGRRGCAAAKPGGAALQGGHCSAKEFTYQSAETIKKRRDFSLLDMFRIALRK